MALTLKFIASLQHVTASDWDKLFAADFPFTRHAFLMALEQGGSVDGQTGWQSHHLTVWHDTQLVAAVPGYIKTHSYGEYLFDWQINQAYEQFQWPYYPKWIAAIPFTPVTGPRLGILATVLEPELVETILPGICHFLQQQLTDTATPKLHSVQWLYHDHVLHERLRSQGFWSRHDIQFLWSNRQYGDFTDFLAGLTSRKRKQIKKERESCAHLNIKTLTGAMLTPQIWQQLIQCYQATYLKRSGHRGYITAASFALIAAELADKIIVFAAFEPNNPEQMLAASLCFVSHDTLYGRYWGALSENELLHFELCYYQGINYCIEHKLHYFDAGAQGEHKLKRGFEPVVRYGAYAFAKTALSPAIARYFIQEKAQLDEYMAAAIAALPYKLD
ncbi:GNAT family N-acetyltransferase [Alishewanella tabrizica]|uniref:BioF2-like acetyltransferase domain-containing protein n=1 Tax=Alishewanella tabrizica TaxID=671278 RepID=A0ABQ2WJ80_9ALTE|nr:GNAT family N-acetyltransferase [Alishewanella tabrizica]GGW57626.1 hypothetical protein GCM10008111_12140 [Alishewanella tabrizica]